MKKQTESNESIVKRIQEGSKQAQSGYMVKDFQDDLMRLYEANRGILGLLVRKYERFNERADLEQEFFLAMYEAARSYEPSKGSFVGLLYQYGNWRFFSLSFGVVKFPGWFFSLKRQYDALVSDFQAQHHSRPTVPEICHYLHISEKRLEQLYRLMDFQLLRSLSESVPGADDITLEETIADPCDPIQEAQEELERQELKKALWEIVDSLPQDQAQALRERFQQDLTYLQIAEQHHCSIEGARRLCDGAIRALKKPKTLRKIQSYLDFDIYGAGMRGIGTNAFIHYGSATERAAIRLYNLAPGSPIAEIHD